MGTATLFLTAVWPTDTAMRDTDTAMILNMDTDTVMDMDTGMIMDTGMVTDTAIHMTSLTAMVSLELFWLFLLLIMFK